MQQLTLNEQQHIRHIMLFSHLKSFRNISSLSSTPNHAKEPVAVLQKDSKIFVSGFSINVLPQFARPVIRIFRPSPLPFSKSSFTASKKSFLLRPFFSSSSCRHISHCPSQMQRFSKAFFRMSILFISCHIIVCSAFSASHTVPINSTSVFVDLLMQNSYSSVLPFFFRALVLRRSSSLFESLFDIIKSATSLFESLRF